MTNRWVGRDPQVLAPSAGAAAVLAIGLALAVPEPLRIVVVGLVLLCGAALVWTDCRTHTGVLCAAAGLTVFDNSPLVVDGSVVRVYQVAAPVVAVLVLRRRRELVRSVRGLPRLVGAALWAMAALTLLTPLSLLWTISQQDTLISSVGQVSSSGLFALFALAVAGQLVSPGQALDSVWAGASLGSAWAVLEFIVTVTTGAPWASSGSGVPWPRPDGFMTEAVWAALVAATGAVLALPARHRWPRLALASLPLHAAVLVMVASRAVVLGIACGVVATALVVWRRRLRPQVLVLLGVGMVLAASAVVVLAPTVASRFDPRAVFGTENSDGGSAQSRSAVYRLAGDVLPDLLPLGGGAGSLNELTSDPGFRDRYIDGGDLNSGRGSTNVFLGNVFDFGWLGVLLNVALVGVIGALALRATRWDGGLAVFLATLFVVDFQFNNGFRFGFVHLLLGVLVGASALHDAGARDSDVRWSGARGAAPGPQRDLSDPTAAR